MYRPGPNRRHVINYDATDPVMEEVRCTVCDRSITGGRWYARLAHGEIMLALCCPLCLETFNRNRRPFIGRIRLLCPELGTRLDAASNPHDLNP